MSKKTQARKARDRARELGLVVIDGGVSKPGVIRLREYTITQPSDVAERLEELHERLKGRAGVSESLTDFLGTLMLVGAEMVDRQTQEPKLVQLVPVS